MDLSFKCPSCGQELEVDASAAGSTIDCPACSNSLTVPAPEAAEEAAPAAEAAEESAPAAEAAAPAPPQPEKHFAVPIHEHVTSEVLIKKANKPLDVAAKESDRTLRVKTIKRTDCLEVGHDKFDEIVSRFLDRVGKENIVSVTSVNYSYLELSSKTILIDYGIMIVYRG
ncbi:MAG: hypothetical protein ABSH38_18830 [Verrucomicrobiota bacterium]|jgi:hypothetical protein